MAQEPSRFKTQRQLDEALETAIAEIVCTRTANFLEEKGIIFVRDVLRCSRDELMAISNFGDISFHELIFALHGLGFTVPKQFRAPPPKSSQTKPKDSEAPQAETSQATP